MSERDELAPMQELDAHRPTHREYTGGWWELACTGCDFAEGRRLSHLDWAPHHAHREEIFRDALLAAGYRKPRTITTAAELAALPFGSAVETSDESDTVVLKCEGELFRNQSGYQLSWTDLWRFGTRPFTVLWEPKP